MRRLIRIIRNLLLLAIALIVILAGALAFNTLTHGSRQLQVAAIPRAEVDARAASKRLAEAIRFRTISSYEKPDQHAEALRGMHAHIEKSFPAFHAAAKREIVAGYSLLYTWEGSEAKAQPIALLAHQDVVPVAPGTEKDWQQPPYDGVMVAATDSRHYTEITDKIFRFSPVRANSEDLKRFHGTNERLPVEGYADMIRFYRRLMENAAG